MSKHCGCGHDHAEEHEKCDDCHCGHEHSAAGHAISHEDMEKLMVAIKEAGFEAQQTPDGEIQILEK